MILRATSLSASAHRQKKKPATKSKGPTRFHVGPFVEIMPAATYSPTQFPTQWLCLLLVASLLAGGSRRWAEHGSTNPQSQSLIEKARRSLDIGPFGITAGSDLLSHTVSHAVPSAVSGLTSVFGMGTGVTLIL